MVDDAIVVVENVKRLIDEEGMNPISAAFAAMREITGAVIATTRYCLPSSFRWRSFPVPPGNCINSSR
ncbi:MAG: efflux RND transporter permease subunit [Cyanobacteriota/Melainabacteria group bacterium]